jgi:DNA-binding NtrC family response regulator
MNSSNETTEIGRHVQTWRPEYGGLESGFPSASRRMQPILHCLRGLVVSSDDEMRQTLAEDLVCCGLGAIIASSAEESRTALFAHNVCMVLCDESARGGYHAVLEIAKSVDVNLPVIVVSRTGDWLEYLVATGEGAFDYLAYPSNPEELPRVIRHAFVARLRQQEKTQTRDTHSPSHARGLR